MPISYNIDSEKNIVSIVVSGETTDSEWYELFHKIKNDEKRNEDMNVFMDFRNHKTIVSTEIIPRIIDYIKQKEKKVKYAFVISRAVSIGMSNMAHILIKDKNIEVKAFKEEEDALNWLKEEKET